MSLLSHDKYGDKKCGENNKHIFVPVIIMFYLKTVKRSGHYLHTSIKAIHAIVGF